MKVTDRIYATCVVAGAIVASLVWHAWDLTWQALGIGFLVGLILYANLTAPKGKPSKEKEKENVFHGLPPPD